MAEYTVDSKGNVTVDGRTMSNSTFRRLYKFSGNFSGVPMRGEKGTATLRPGVKVKEITVKSERTSEPKTKKEVRAARKKAKSQAKSVRKITELSPRQEKKELRSTPAQKEARKAAYERAKAIPREERTPAQQRAIKNFIARKNDSIYGTRPKPDIFDRAIERMNEASKRREEIKVKKTARSTKGGARGGARGGAGLGGVPGIGFRSKTTR